MKDLNMTRSELGGMIDHAILAPDCTMEDLRRGCEMVARYNVHCICVRPCDVIRARKLLDGTNTIVGTVIGFPHGSQTTRIKVAETAQSLSDGAEEFDMVINIGSLRSGDVQYIRDEIAAVVQAAAPRTVKVILECCYLTRDEIAAASRAAIDAGAHFVKTSTGTGPEGAKVNDVRFLRAQVGDKLGVKAAGGIRTLPDALEMIHAGASRIGTSSTQAILDELMT